MDARTIFYLRNGWLTEEVARIFGMYEDGEESVGDELGVLDSYVNKLQQRIAEFEAGAISRHYMAEDIGYQTS